MITTSVFYQLFNIRPTKVITEKVYVKLLMLARRYGIIAVRAEHTYGDLLDALCGQLISILVSLKDEDKEKFKWLVAKQFMKGKDSETDN